jgi:L,D-peptidoglycan transpeptidase YkuD (ErfK/YbiS/YcfS/YnhG family)
VLNQHRRCAPGTCPSSYGGFERLGNYPTQYAYAAFIGYNAPAPYGTGAVRGKGSAFFLHVKNAYATGGCVAVSEAQMAALLRWLRPTARPVISIGVGVNAYAPIPYRYV